ncbi:MAG: ubiquinone/menaquinone biosynthesis methyltransferase [Deltaproteobacteria bacterium]|jgi:ubiquinone/menaquinone biosynthesis methyltransferase|nr:ubiquinone/menaquinone biosynthesis methyltransferase [Deltaproteobacteria bacterium]MCL5880057.1 ubiquinone/menaquinone biosynthesis methyltransferase [Deltaproteobacteria bacterium]MDA8304508.1 ubiquinone/menaquinone biosynthesis methyltransferase [Deltaproteobacteria bacterium]
MSKKIFNIFSSIADVYDVVGHLFSFGIDGLWREMTAREALIEKSSYKILDVATGTGSIAIDIAKKAKKAKKQVEITAVDFNKDMLRLAEEKINKRKINNICIKAEDAMKLDEPDCYYDVVTAGFLLRNVDDTKIFADELKRVLKKTGKFILLGMGKPQNKLLNMFFKVYFILLRLVGSSIDKTAYRWLTYSIMAFDRNKMLNILKDKGFKDLKIKNLPFHIAFIITGIK